MASVRRSPTTGLGFGQEAGGRLSEVEEETLSALTEGSVFSSVAAGAGAGAGTTAEPSGSVVSEADEEAEAEASREDEDFGHTGPWTANARVAWAAGECEAYVASLNCFSSGVERRFLEDALRQAVLPLPWVAHRDQPDSQLLFENTSTSQHSRQHPLESFLPQLAELCRKCLALGQDDSARSSLLDETAVDWRSQAKAEAGKWRAVHYDDEYDYFYHTETRETRWESPTVIVFFPLNFKLEALHKLQDAAYWRSLAEEDKVSNGEVNDPEEEPPSEASTLLRRAPTQQEEEAAVVIQTTFREIRRRYTQEERQLEERQRPFQESALPPQSVMPPEVAPMPTEELPPLPEDRRLTDLSPLASFGTEDGDGDCEGLSMAVPAILVAVPEEEDEDEEEPRSDDEARDADAAHGAEAAVADEPDAGPERALAAATSADDKASSLNDAARQAEIEEQAAISIQDWFRQTRQAKLEGRSSSSEKEGQGEEQEEGEEDNVHPGAGKLAQEVGGDGGGANPTGLGALDPDPSVPEAKGRVRAGSLLSLDPDADAATNAEDTSSPTAATAMTEQDAASPRVDPTLPDTAVVADQGRKRISIGSCVEEDDKEKSQAKELVEGSLVRWLGEDRPGTSGEEAGLVALSDVSEDKRRESCELAEDSADRGLPPERWASSFLSAPTFGPLSAADSLSAPCQQEERADAAAAGSAPAAPEPADGRLGAVEARKASQDPPKPEKHRKLQKPREPRKPQKAQKPQESREPGAESDEAQEPPKPQKPQKPKKTREPEEPEQAEQVEHAEEPEEPKEPKKPEAESDESAGKPAEPAEGASTPLGAFREALLVEREELGALLQALDCAPLVDGTKQRLGLQADEEHRARSALTRLLQNDRGKVAALESLRSSLDSDLAASTQPGDLGRLLGALDADARTALCTACNEESREALALLRLSERQLHCDDGTVGRRQATATLEETVVAPPVDAPWLGRTAVRPRSRPRQQPRPRRRQRPSSASHARGGKHLARRRLSTRSQLVAKLADRGVASAPLLDLQMKGGPKVSELIEAAGEVDRSIARAAWKEHLDSRQVWDIFRGWGFEATLQDRWDPKVLPRAPAGAASARRAESPTPRLAEADPLPPASAPEPPELALLGLRLNSGSRPVGVGWSPAGLAPAWQALQRFRIEGTRSQRPCNYSRGLRIAARLAELRAHRRTGRGKERREAVGVNVIIARAAEERKHLEEWHRTWVGRLKEAADLLEAAEIRQLVDDGAADAAAAAQQADQAAAAAASQAVEGDEEAAAAPASTHADEAPDAPSPSSSRAVVKKSSSASLPETPKAGVESPGRRRAASEASQRSSVVCRDSMRQPESATSRSGSPVDRSPEAAAEAPRRVSVTCRESPRSPTRPTSCRGSIAESEASERAGVSRRESLQQPSDCTSPASGPVHEARALLLRRAAQNKSGSEVSTQPQNWGLTLRQLTSFRDRIMPDLKDYVQDHPNAVRLRGRVHHVCRSGGCHFATTCGLGFDDHEGMPYIAEEELLDLKESDTTLETQELRPDVRLAVDRHVRPLAQKRQCSFALMLNPEGLRATTFVSHTWSEDFGGLVASLEAALPPSEALWLAAFALKQPQKDAPIARACALAGPTKRARWRSEAGDPESASALLQRSAFAVAISYAQRLLVVVDKKLEYPCRSWCIYELLTARRMGVPALIWPSEQGLLPGLEQRVNSFRSQDGAASLDEDVQLLKEAMDPRGDPGGFRRLDDELRGFWGHWLQLCQDAAADGGPVATEDWPGVDAEAARHLRVLHVKEEALAVTQQLELLASVMKADSRLLCGFAGLELEAMLLEQRQRLRSRLAPPALSSLDDSFEASWPRLLPPTPAAVQSPVYMALNPSAGLGGPPVGIALRAAAGSAAAAVRESPQARSQGWQPRACSPSRRPRSAVGLQRSRQESLEEPSFSFEASGPELQRRWLQMLYPSPEADDEPEDCSISYSSSGGFVPRLRQECQMLRALQSPMALHRSAPSLQRPLSVGGRSAARPTWDHTHHITSSRANEKYIPSARKYFDSMGGALSPCRAWLSPPAQRAVG